MVDPTYVLPAAAPVLPLRKAVQGRSNDPVLLALVDENNRIYEELRQTQLKLNQLLNYLNQQGI